MKKKIVDRIFKKKSTLLLCDKGKQKKNEIGPFKEEDKYI